MSLNIAIPQPGEKATTRDYIITVLGYDWPLTAKKIYNLIKKRYGHNVTYQAVFKTLNELKSKEIIEKGEEGYQINLKWLKQIHAYTELIETNYYTKNRLQLIEGIKEARKEGNINVLSFEKFFDVEKYLYYLQKHHIQNTNKKEIICVHHNHEWRPLFYLRAEYNWIRKVKEKGHQIYILCAGNTSVDKWCSDFYKKLGCNVKLKANCGSPAELMVFGDIVIQVYIPYALKEELGKAFRKVKEINKLNHDSLIKNIFEKKSDIQVIINKDSKLAEQIKKETIMQFTPQK